MLTAVGLAAGACAVVERVGQYWRWRADGRPVQVVKASVILGVGLAFVSGGGAAPSPAVVGGRL